MGLRNRNGGVSRLNVAAGMLLNATALDTEAPSVPANLAASDIEETTLTLTWDASTDNVGVVSYEVQQRLTSGVDGDYVTIYSGILTTSAVTGLTDGTSYRFRVRAVDGAGNASAWSSGVDVTTVAAFVFVAPSFDGDVYGCIPDGTSFIFVGAFTQATGVNGAFARNKVCRVDALGAIEAWSPNANSSVYHAAVDGDWAYLVGAYTQMGGASHARVCRVSRTTGARDATWNPVAVGNSPHGVYVDARGVWVISSAATSTYNGVNRNGVACLDKTTALLTAWDHGRASRSTNVYGVSFDEDSVYVVGNFTGLFGGLSRSGGVRLDLDTALPLAWDPQSTSLTGSVAIQGGYAYIATGYTGVAWAGGPYVYDNMVTRVDATTGVRDATYLPLVKQCFAVTPSAGGIILGLSRLVTADIATVGGLTRKGVAAISAFNGVPTALNPLLTRTVEADFAMEYCGKDTTQRGALCRFPLVAGDTKMIVYGRFENAAADYHTKGINCAVINL